MPDRECSYLARCATGRRIFAICCCSRLRFPRPELCFEPCRQPAILPRQIDEPIARRRPAFRLGDVIKARCLLAIMQRSRPLGPKAPRFAKGPTPACLPQPAPLDSPGRARAMPSAMSSRCGHLTRANSRDRERSEMIISLNPFPYSVSNSRDVGGCGRLAFDRGLRGAVRRSRRVRGLSLVALAVAGHLPDLRRGDRTDGFNGSRPSSCRRAPL